MNIHSHLQRLINSSNSSFEGILQGLPQCDVATSNAEFPLISVVTLCFKELLQNNLRIAFSSIYVLQLFLQKNEI